MLPHTVLTLILVFLVCISDCTARIQVSSNPVAIELPYSRRALLLLKDRLTPNGVLQVLANDIDNADAAWQAILAASSGQTPIPAISTVEALIPSHIMNASAFLTWFSSPAPHKLLQAHPEHYVEIESVANGITSINIVEEWGSLLFHYSIPNYGPGPKKPYMATLKDYPYQAVGKVTLRDGTVIANIHNSLRDKEDGTGIEAVLYGWLPSAAPTDVIQGLRNHQSIEFSNWLQFAYNDTIGGDYFPVIPKL
ncbi:hypothetical protein B0J14DRAFT_167117 [Halenospora varia]|nr:hypothetical protein B0J14DRAFT_167117 [Halenospora varia]